MLGLGVQGGNTGSAAALAVQAVVVVQADHRGHLGDQGVAVRVAACRGARVQGVRAVGMIADFGIEVLGGGQMERWQVRGDDKGDKGMKRLAWQDVL